jgi:hypothetical protein
MTCQSSITVNNMLWEVRINPQHIEISIVLGGSNYENGRELKPAIRQIRSRYLTNSRFPIPDSYPRKNATEKMRSRDGGGNSGNNILEGPTAVPTGSADILSAAGR